MEINRLNNITNIMKEKRRLVLGLCFAALVLVFLLVSMHMRTGSKDKKVVTTPTGSPVVPTSEENPNGYTYDAQKKVYLLPTVPPQYGSASSPEAASASGFILGQDNCEKLQNVLRCYAKKLPDMLKGYEDYISGELYGDDPPSVREQKCSQILERLGGDSEARLKAITGGCAW
jgi:hypothetical protein